MKASFSSLRGHMRVDTKSAAIGTNALERNYLLRKCEASKLRKTKGRKEEKDLDYRIGFSREKI